MTAATAQDAINVAVKENVKELKDDIEEVGARMVSFPSGLGFVATGAAFYREMPNPTATRIAKRQAYVIAFTKAKKNLAEILGGLSNKGKESVREQPRRQEREKIMTCVQDSIAFRKFAQSTALLLSFFPTVACRVGAAELAPSDQKGKLGRSEMRLDLTGESLSPAGAKPQVVDVVATGAGATPEQAQQNAFSAAIEQVVGVLVDAETLVTNDDVVRDQVLTFSRGYVNEFAEIARWEKDGLHFVRIRAKVAASKLGEKLHAQNIATRQIPGSLLYGNLMHERLSEENARAMFRRATVDFRPDKLVSVAISNKQPAVEDAGGQVKLTIAYALTANLEAWKSIQTNLKLVFEGIATKHCDYTHTSTPRGYGRTGYLGDWESPHPIERDRKDDRVIFLFKGSTPECNTTYWDAYLMPQSFKQEMSALAAGHGRYRIRFHLVDSDDRIIASLERGLGNSLVCAWASPTDPFKSASLGPLLYADQTFRSTRDDTVTFTIDADQLGRVAKCVASLELALADR